MTKTYTDEVVDMMLCNLNETLYKCVTEPARDSLLYILFLDKRWRVLEEDLIDKGLIVALVAKHFAEVIKCANDNLTELLNDSDNSMSDSMRSKLSSIKSSLIPLYC